MGTLRVWVLVYTRERYKSTLCTARTRGRRIEGIPIPSGPWGSAACSLTAQGRTTRAVTQCFWTQDLHGDIPGMPNNLRSGRACHTLRFTQGQQSPRRGVTGYGNDQGRMGAWRGLCSCFGTRLPVRSSRGRSWELGKASPGARGNILSDWARFGSTGIPVPSRLACL